MYRVDVYPGSPGGDGGAGKSIREVSREFGLHRDTVHKMLTYPCLRATGDRLLLEGPTLRQLRRSLHRRHRPGPGG